MDGYAKVNLKRDPEDAAAKFGMSPNLEFRLGRTELGAQESAISYLRIAPGFRVPFGHTHERQEEVYLVVGGSGRIKLDDDIVDVKQWDAVRVAAGTWRGFEAGPEGIELIAYGARCGMGPDDNDTDMEQGWWGD